jgi:serine protease Do
MKRWTIPLVALLLGLGLGSYFMNTHSHGQSVEPQKPQVAPPEFTSYRDIVKKVLPGVVSIDAKGKTPAAVQGVAPPPNAPEEFRRFFEQFGQVPNGGPARLGFGSGFFINADGVVVTNFHVVEGADQVVVQLADGRKFNSKEIFGDRRTDLAVVKLDLKGAKVPFLEFGDSNAMEIGDQVLAVGAPFGLTGSVTHGIISAKGRSGLNMNMYEDFLQTDAAVNPGNSGGPLVNLSGQVVGINAAIKSQSGGFQGVGLAVASNLAQQVVKALRTDGIVRRGYLGVQIQDLNSDVAARIGLTDTGVVVSEVYDKTPAQKAGLLAGDVITSINGKSVKNGKSLQSIVAMLPVGKACDFALFRDGKAMTVPVTVEEQPTQFGATVVPAPRRPRPNQGSISVSKVGVDLADMNDGLAEDFGFRLGTQGVVITRIDGDSPAAAAELRPGAIIVKIDNQRVNSAQSARQLLEAASLARGILLQVQSPQGGLNYVLVKSEGN